MAALPENNTARFRFHYSTAGFDHSLQVRSASSPLVVGTLVDQWFTDIGIAGITATMNFVDWAPSGSNIFNPIATGIEGNTYGTPSFTPDKRAYAYVFVGRTAGGRRVRWMRFGATTHTDDYRIVAGESAFIDAAIGRLVANAAAIVGIDGLPVVWKSYVNVKPNDHWVKRSRG
jgi:hypothetical protein